MLKTLKTFIDTQLGVIAGADETDGDAERSYQYATAMLLLEMTRADFEVKPEERTAVVAAIQSGFELSPAETRELVTLAESEVDHATCLHEFTRAINDQLSSEKKGHVVELLWEVAYADGQLDKYEENFVRRIAELLHVRHRELIQAKHRVEGRLS